LVDRLRAAVEGRRANLLPVRWARMAASPFGFFRGAADLMAADLGPMPASGLDVQVCGDAHLLNLGAYAVPDGHAVLCGAILAKAHARTGDAAMLSGYCGRGDRLDRALVQFAFGYADQTEADHAQLCKAIRAGKLEAREPGS